jgi:hypothetical protein
MAPQILVVALFIALAPLIRHLKNPPGTSQHSIG